jgi:hypothetical protein
MVPEEGIEPTRALSPPDFESDISLEKAEIVGANRIITAQFVSTALGGIGPDVVAFTTFRTTEAEDRADERRHRW